MRHLKLLPKLRAESLIETMVAITVIVLATTAALVVMRTSQEGNDVIGKKLVAMNLAEEALEALRNIRDTNYLRYASDPDQCWRAYDLSKVSDCSDPAHQLTENVTYVLNRNWSGSALLAWSVETMDDSTHEGYVDHYRVDYDGDKIADGEVYAPSELPESLGFYSQEEADFQRGFTIEYGDSNSDGVEDYYNATVRVSWVESGLERSIIFTRSIGHVY